MLGKKQGKQRLESVSDYVVFDVETTGISCRYDEIVELSALKVKDGKVVEEFSTLVKAERPISYGASMVNGITDDMLVDAPKFDTVLADFIEFIENLPLVGHNISTFDMKFIYKDCEKYFGKIPDNDYIDTLMLSRMCLADMKHHKLTDVAEHYEISTDGAHRALNDCRMNRLVYEGLCADMKTGSFKEPQKCPKCGQYLVKRSGKYGAFLGCSGYPDCKYTENLKG
ncbi:MAG: topoisomerase DNA-binding C4 zinc finger domain-containing protein [Lachnospiraceae bacterium]|nr:topoisomerase DNA-binding C4 zinc finger domain-containing protein [Lachnospiraceae bacterium]